MAMRARYEFRRQPPQPQEAASVVLAPEPAAVPAAQTDPDRLSEAIVIIDSTLRDGEQVPGVAFSPEDKLRVATRLAAIGVPVIEAGFPAVSPEEVAAVRGIVDAGLESEIQVIARPLKHDIDVAVDSGAQSIALFIGTSDSHIERKLRTDRKQVLRQVRDSVGYAKRSGRRVVLVAEDATRTDPDFLAVVCIVAANAGADAIGLADTVGVATPKSIAQLVRHIIASCPLPVGVHCHNDLGMATANSIAALTAGAATVQCSVLGLGGRAGATCLEELALALEVAYDYRTGLDLRGLQPLAEHVALLAGQSVPPGKAVVGRNAFLHESGLHTGGGIVREPSTYEPYPPELTGRSRGFAVGRNSGRSGIGYLLARHDLVLSTGEMDRLLNEIKRRKYRGEPLREDELLRLALDSIEASTIAKLDHGLDQSYAGYLAGPGPYRQQLKTGETW